MMTVPKIKRKHPEPLGLVPALHPTGFFRAELVEWGEIKESLRGNLWYTTAKLKTSSGHVHVTLSGLPAALLFIVHSPKSDSYLVRVRHVEHNFNTYASAEFWYREVPDDSVR